MLSGKVFVKNHIVRDQTFVTAEVSCSGQRTDNLRHLQPYYKKGGLPEGALSELQRKGCEHRVTKGTSGASSPALARRRAPRTRLLLAPVALEPALLEKRVYTGIAPAEIAVEVGRL